VVRALAFTDSNSSGSSRTVRRGWPRLITEPFRTPFSAVVATHDPPACLDVLVACSDALDAAGACAPLWPAAPLSPLPRPARHGHRPGAASRYSSVSEGSGMAHASFADPGHTDTEGSRIASTAKRASTPPDARLRRRVRSRRGSNVTPRQHPRRTFSAIAWAGRSRTGTLSRFSTG